jgi:hypothetical protein
MPRLGRGYLVAVADMFVSIATLGGGLILIYLAW